MPGTAFSSRSPLSTRLRAARAVCHWMPPLVSQRIRRLIYPQAVARREAIQFTAPALTGSSFTGTTADHVAYPFAVHGYFNWRNVAIAQAICGAGDVIFDIGANIGSETVAFSDIVGAAGAVYAFEPFPSNVELLMQNASQTRARNVEVLPVALGDRRAVVRFAAPAPGNSGSGYVLAPRGEEAARGGGPGIVEVTCTRLDELASQLRPPRLIAIDAEGHEASILEGAARLLRRDRPALILEALEPLLVRAGSSPEALARQLVGLDYVLAEIQRFTLKPIDVAAGRIPRHADWLAVPSLEVRSIKGIRRTLRRAGMAPVIPKLNPLCLR